MNQMEHLANLQEIISQLNFARKHLEISFERCKSLKLKKEPMETDLIEIEALASRFSRVTDMLVHKVFRSIDAIEFLEGGTLIDTLNRAEKRNLIQSKDEIREIKDLRNEIAHEYIIEELWLLHQEVFTLVPKVLNLVQRANEYVLHYGICKIKNDSRE